MNCNPKNQAKASVSHEVGFSGIRPLNKLDGLRVASSRTSFCSKTSLARSKARTTCAATSLIITLSTGGLLFLGRFVFLPFQRAQVAKAGLPQQNGVTHFEAGDSRAQEVVSLLKTNDPAGFTIVDVLAWGALGHAIGFFILATSSNGYEPQF
ncbi:hypothetical protein O6H91_01G065900 [Diphasiastrum complanatum]|nr:hypothetical protein O6H91_01G065900 [Diphasiastrum complanatum]